MNREQRLAWLLRQMLDALPQQRDWLDPHIEREARALAYEPVTPDPDAEKISY